MKLKAIAIWVCICFLPKLYANPYQDIISYADTQTNEAKLTLPTPPTSAIPQSNIEPERRLIQLTRLLQQPSRFRYRVAGYTRLISYADSRQVIGSEPDDYVLFVPKPALLDPCGRDINARGEYHMIPFETRLLTYIIGPEVCGFHSHARIEGDFLGRVNAVDLFGEATFIMDRLRLRHAYIDLEAERVAIRIGQAWNPLTNPLESPNTISFNTGVPFNPYLRMPQIKLTFFSPKFHLIAAILARRNNVDDGPEGFSSVYSSRALSPDIHAQLRIHLGDNYIGGGLSYGRLMPRLETDCGFATRSTLASVIGIFYGKLSMGKTGLTVKCTIAQNGTHIGMIGGYAVKTLNRRNDQQTYTNLRSVGIWTELVHDREYMEWGIFAGYLRNRGFEDPIILSPPELECEPIRQTDRTIYGLLQNVQTAWRIQPRMRIVCDNTTFGFELEYTGTIFGTFAESGKLVDLQPTVYNLRGLFSVKYNFA